MPGGVRVLWVFLMTLAYSRYRYAELVLDLGVEIPLEHRFQFNVEGFFNYMDPTIFDLQRPRSPLTTSEYFLPILSWVAEVTVAR